MYKTPFFIGTGYNSPEDYGPSVVKNFFSEGNFKLLESQLSKIDFTTATDDAQEKGIVKDVRVSSIKWIQHTENFIWLYKKLYEISYKYNQKTKFDISHTLDGIQYTEYYGSEKGKYDWHMDSGANSVSRKISISVLLNDPSEFEGGELEFFLGGDYNDESNSLKFNAKLEKFSACIFPSFMMHRVKPVTKGVRKSLVFWIGGSSHWK
jgi:PKHD-type hydroxylase